MGTIDRYLLRQFFRVFVICFCSLTGLFVVFDLFSNLDDFLNFGEKHGGLVKALAEYYSYRSVALFDRMSGVLVLTAAMFTITWFRRFNELTALWAAGISSGRVARPLVGAALVVSLVAAASRELLIPHFRDELARSAKDLAGEVAQELKPRYDNETDVLMRGRLVLARERRIHLPDFLLPPALDHYGRRLVAGDAYYQPPADGRPGGYRFQGVVQPEGLAGKPSLWHQGKPVLITPHDEPGWLAAHECFIASQVDFEQLTGGQAWRHYSSTMALVRGLRNRSLDFGADVRVAIHSRLLKPLVDVLLLFLGLPLVLGRDNRNMFVAVGLCVAVVAGFMLVVIGAQYLGAVYLVDPALAAWLPLVIFVPLAAFLAEPLVE